MLGAFYLIYLNHKFEVLPRTSTRTDNVKLLKLLKILEVRGKTSNLKGDFL